MCCHLMMLVEMNSYDTGIIKVSAHEEKSNTTWSETLSDEIPIMSSELPSVVFSLYCYLPVTNTVYALTNDC